MMLSRANLALPKEPTNSALLHSPKTAKGVESSQQATKAKLLLLDEDVPPEQSKEETESSLVPRKKSLTRDRATGLDVTAGTKSVGFASTMVRGQPSRRHNSSHTVSLDSKFTREASGWSDGKRAKDANSKIGTIKVKELYKNTNVVRED